MSSDILLQEKGIHLIGDFSGKTALCQSGRDLVAAARHANYPIQILDLPLSQIQKRNGRIDMADVDYQSPVSPISIINWNGDCYPILGDTLPEEIFENRRIIGIWYWETAQELPESYRRGFDYVDEIWVTSQFVADSIAKYSPVPVRKFPHLMEPVQPPESLILPPALQNDRFMFLFTFDFKSQVKRKNPHAVCEAFTKAFPVPKADGPICVIKSVSGEDHEIQLLELSSRYLDRPDLIFIDGWVSFQERDSLFARADCYVSLHRSEGLGLTLMESMSRGKPCIATGYSGNLEFMNSENSWLIPYQFVPVGEGVWPYPPDHSWAEADTDSAAKAMRSAFESPELARKKGELGHRTILEQNNLQAVGTRIMELLEESIQLEARPKDFKRPQKSSDGNPDGSSPPMVLSGRAAAYELLKESKALEKEAKTMAKRLNRRKLSSEAIEYFETLQEIIKLQQRVHSETLRDLGEIKRRIAGYHASKISDLIGAQKTTVSLLSNLVEQVKKGYPADSETPSENTE